MTPKKRAVTRNTVSSLIWKYPFGAEREYTVWIDKEFRENIVLPVNRYVQDNYLNWLAESRRDSDELHSDGIADIFRGIKNATRNAFTAIGKIFTVGNRVNTVNEGQWNRFLKESTGVNMQLYTPTAQPYVQEWIDSNRQYLSTLPDEYANRIFQIVSQGVEDGETKGVIGERIHEAGRSFRGVTTGNQRRAERIARDQIGKLNSTLSRARMTQARVAVYKWSTAGDERVRGTPGGSNPKSRYSHYIMDRRYKQVDNANKISDNGIDWRRVRGREEPRHAGNAINCRCVMIPSFIQIKNIVDSDIRRDLRSVA
jgi:uncharacterized protein with gpF-like domain